MLNAERSDETIEQLGIAGDPHQPFLDRFRRSDFAGHQQSQRRAGLDDEVWSLDGSALDGDRAVFDARVHLNPTQSVHKLTC